MRRKIVSASPVQRIIYVNFVNSFSSCNKSIINRQLKHKRCMPIPTIKQTEQKYLVSYMFFSKLRQEVRTKMTHAKLCFYVKQPIEFEFFTRKLAVDFLRNR